MATFSFLLFNPKCAGGHSVSVCYLLLTSDFDSKAHLFLWVSIRIQLADTAFEDIVPSHFKEIGYHDIIIPGDIANQEFILYNTLLVLTLIDDSDSICIINVPIKRILPSELSEKVTGTSKTLSRISELMKNSTFLMISSLF